MNSLNQRLTVLEEAVSNVPNNSLLNKIRLIEQDKREKQISELCQSYLNYLDIKESERIVEIIFKSIKYIKENLTNISKVLNVRASTDLEVEILIYFISILQLTYTDDFIRETYKFLVSLPIKEPEPEPQPEQFPVLPVIKRSGGMSSLFRFKK